MSSRTHKWVRAAALADVPADGRARGVRLEGLDVAVMQWNERFYALENQCPHLGFPLTEGQLHEGVLVCGWHGWRIRLEDGGCPGKTAAARTYPCEARGPDLWVEVPVIP